MAETMNSNFPKSNKSTKPRKKMDPVLGLHVEAWLVVFMLLAIMPVFNLYVLPAVLTGLALLLAIYILWRITHV